MSVGFQSWDADAAEGKRGGAHSSGEAGDREGYRGGEEKRRVQSRG